MGQWKKKNTYICISVGSTKSVNQPVQTDIILCPCPFHALHIYYVIFTQIRRRLGGCRLRSALRLVRYCASFLDEMESAICPVYFSPRLSCLGTGSTRRYGTIWEALGYVVMYHHIVSYAGAFQGSCNKWGINGCVNKNSNVTYRFWEKKGVQVMVFRIPEKILQALMKETHLPDVISQPILSDILHLPTSWFTDLGQDRITVFH